MKTSILYTKLQRPPVVSDIVPRQRLFEKLNTGRTSPLTLISAPAGYGKSTLASRWSAACDGPSGWVSLDEGDNDLGQFLRYILAAVRSMFPDAVLKSEMLLEANPLPKTAELAQYLLNDLHQLPTQFILVLDDYHRIKQALVHDLVTALLKNPARSMHLVLVTRKDPSLPIATLRGRALVTEIRASDLRFTSDEVAVFMHRILDVAIDEATADLIEAKTEGWATGLRLAALYLQGSKDLKSRVLALSGNTSHIAEYLISEVLNRRRPEMVSYLLTASILDRFCAPLCRQMYQKNAGNHDVSADQFIQWLLNNNLFTIALDDEGRWFRYHHLFQGFLKNQLRKQYSDGQIADLHRVAGNWFAENDLIEEAIGHLLAAGAVKDAVQLVLDRRYDLMNNSKFFLLNRLIGQLPANTVEEIPLLATAKAYIGLDLGNDGEMYAYTQKALQMSAERSPASEAYAETKGEVNVLQGLIEIILGDADSALLHVREGLENLPNHALFIRSMGFGILSISHQMKGNGEQAVGVIREALSESIWPVNLQARLHFYLAIEQYLDADLFGTMRASRQCLQTIQKHSFTHTRVFAHYFLGVTLYQQNEPAAAESELLNVMEHPHAANPSYLAYAGFLLAHIHLTRGNETAARQVLDLVTTHCRENSHTIVLSIAQAFEVEFMLLKGDDQQALRLYKQVDFDVRPPAWFHYIPQLTPIKCLLAQGTPDAMQTAHARLMELDDRMRRINRKNVRIELLVLLALVCHKQRDDIGVCRHLHTALDLGEPGGWMRIFVDLGEPMANLLKQFLEHHPAHTFARHVLDACLMSLRTHAPPTVRRLSHANGLTRRENEVLSLLAEGLSNKEIAEKLFVSPGTVKTHVKKIFKKLNVRRRMEAVKIGLGS